MSRAFSVTLVICDNQFSRVGYRGRRNEGPSAENPVLPKVTSLWLRADQKMALHALPFAWSGAFLIVSS